MRSPIKVYSVDAINKRDSPGMGRCRWTFCLPTVMKLISEESGIDIKDVLKQNEASKIIISSSK